MLPQGGCPQELWIQYYHSPFFFPWACLWVLDVNFKKSNKCGRQVCSCMQSYCANKDWRPRELWQEYVINWLKLIIVILHNHGLIKSKDNIVHFAKFCNKGIDAPTTQRHFWAYFPSSTSEVCTSEQGHCSSSLKQKIYPLRGLALLLIGTRTTLHIFQMG